MKLYTIDGRELTDEEVNRVFVYCGEKRICADPDKWYAWDSVYTAEELSDARRESAPNTKGARAEHPTFFERLAEALKEEGCENWDYFFNADDERE